MPGNHLSVPPATCTKRYADVGGGDGELGAGALAAAGGFVSSGDFSGVREFASSMAAGSSGIEGDFRFVDYMCDLTMRFGHRLVSSLGDSDAAFFHFDTGLSLLFSEGPSGDVAYQWFWCDAGRTGSPVRLVQEGALLGRCEKCEPRRCTIGEPNLSSRVFLAELLDFVFGGSAQAANRS